MGQKNLSKQHRGHRKRFWWCSGSNKYSSRPTWRKSLGKSYRKLRMACRSHCTVIRSNSKKVWATLIDVSLKSFVLSGCSIFGHCKSFSFLWSKASSIQVLRDEPFDSIFEKITWGQVTREASCKMYKSAKSEFMLKCNCVIVNGWTQSEWTYDNKHDDNCNHMLIILVHTCDILKRARGIEQSF